jgi:K(+)-stimulated pyrophosphate-energized sodium pump
MSWLLLGGLKVGNNSYDNLWAQLAFIISLRYLGGGRFLEFTKVFTSSHSRHVLEIVTASREWCVTDYPVRVGRW